MLAWSANTGAQSSMNAKVFDAHHEDHSGPACHFLLVFYSIETILQLFECRFKHKSGVPMFSLHISPSCKFTESTPKHAESCKVYIGTVHTT